LARSALSGRFESEAEASDAKELIAGALSVGILGLRSHENLIPAYQSDSTWTWGPVVYPFHLTKEAIEAYLTSLYFSSYSKCFNPSRYLR
jgi:hypothetical protein